MRHQTFVWPLRRFPSTTDRLRAGLLAGVLVLVPMLAQAAASDSSASSAPVDGANDASSEITDLDLDFDLLASPEFESRGSESSAPGFLDPQFASRVAVRRTMLTAHQLVGIGLVVGELGSIVTGQLNYNDTFIDGGTARFRLPHKAFVYPTMALALTSASLSIFAPVPIERRGGFDRMTLHRIGMFTAFAGWAAQLGLGLYAASRDGYADHQTWAKAHLAVGYVTLAGTAVGLGTLAF